MKLATLLLLGTVLISGCASVSHAPLTTEASQKLQGKTVSPVQYAPPDFTAFTAGKAAFAVLGAVAMISEGNAIVKDNEIPDPAVAISRELSKRLESARATKTIESAQVAQSDEISGLVAARPGSNYLLDVKTMNWMFNYYPTNWAGYRVTYVARLRLIDTATKSVIAESACQTVQGNDANPPSKDQLLEKKAALLKEYLAKASAACVDVLAKNVLQL